MIAMVALEVGGAMPVVVRRGREEMRAIRDRLLLDLAAGRRVRVSCWARQHGVHWQRAYTWLREIECEGVLMIVQTTDGEYVRADRVTDAEIADR